MDVNWVLRAALPIIATSTLVVYVGALRSRDVRKMIQGQQAHEGANSNGAGNLSNELAVMGGEHGQTVLDTRGALMMPAMGSFVLVTFYFLFSQLQSIVILYIMAASFASTYFVFQDPLRRACLKAGIVLSRKSIGYLSTTIAMCILLAWVYTGHWSLNNILGACICVSMISFLKLPNLKIAATCLGSLFLYDIFWVFFSSSIFGTNVMVEVATKAAVNPASTLGQALNLPLIRSAAPSLQLPLKFIFPYPVGGGMMAYSMLGLGDMAIPGLFVAFALHFDDFLSLTLVGKKQDDATYLPTSPTNTTTTTTTTTTIVLPSATRRIEQTDTECHCCEDLEGAAITLIPTSSKDLLLHHHPVSFSSQPKYSYFFTGLIGYVVGIICSLFFSRAFSAAQPALLYLVPCVLGPISVKAYRASHLSHLWNGFDDATVYMNEEGGRRGEKGREETREGGENEVLVV